MRKAGAKEGSIGSKGAIDVHRSPVSIPVKGRQSDLMIKFCNCTGRSSSSSLRNLNNTGISMTCKGCSGDSTADRGGPSCSNKLNRMALPRPINPEVRWNSVNRKQRTARRARTSFFGGDIMKDELKSFYAFGNAINREKSQKDAPVSDSEEHGVSILGRRFSDPLGNVPIKKRRFHMDCSPSPPPTPLPGDPYENMLRSCSGGIPLYEKRPKVKMLEDECKEEHRGPFDFDDFSGISILAAAACESEMDSDMLNGLCSKLGHPLEERKLEKTTSSTENLLHDMKGDKSNVLEASNCTYDVPVQSSYSAPDTKPLFATKPTSSDNQDESASAPKVNCSLYSALDSADKEEIASDTKSSSIAMLSDSGNPATSLACSQHGATQTECASATRDSRLHWDLNVAMEAWDTDCGSDDHGGPTVATASNHNDVKNDMNKPELPHDHDSIDAGDAPDHSADQIHVVDIPKDVNKMEEGDFTVGSSSQPLQHQSSQNLQVLKSESIGKDISEETLNLPDQQKSRFASAVVHLGSDPEPILVTEHFPSTANVEKNEVSHLSAASSKGLSHISYVNGHVGGNSTETSELGFTVRPLASRLVSEESTNLPTVTAFHGRITDVGWSDNKLEEASEQSISELKNQELLDDSGTSKMHQSISKKGEHAENLTHPEDNLGSSVCDMTHVHEDDGADAMINSKDCLVTCASSSSAETYYILGAVQTPALSSECTKPVVTDAGSIVDSQAAGHSYKNTYGNELRKVASDTCIEHCYETDASHYSKNAAGIGKVDAEEDDSQYEDGEVRESGDWAGDAYEEVKCGTWHYQTSDYKNESVTPDMPPLLIDSASKNVGIPVSYRTQSRKADDNVSPALSKHLVSTNCLDAGSGASGKAWCIHSRVTGQTEMYEINPGRETVGSAATVSQSEKCNDVRGDDLLSIRMKNTDWDMLSEERRHSQRDSRDRADSSNRYVSSSLDAAGGDGSLRRTGLSDRDVQRLERPRSFDRPLRNVPSRSDDGYASGSKAERAIDSHRSNVACDVPRRIPAGNRDEQQVENSKYPHSTRHKSPECYNYGSAGPRNAAEATVAKMESNGFVVARDGTLVRAVDAANVGHIARRMINTSSSYRPSSGRGSPVDRDGTCRLSRGPAQAREASSERQFGTNSNCSRRYGPQIEKEHTSHGNLSSVRCSLPSRQRGIPTGRASQNLSRAHSRSPSGSRSRSPHDWASSRNRRKIMANGGSTLRRPSRSPPNRMARVRVGSMTSPKRQPEYDDRAMRYSPPSRNHNYPHASAWVDGRNNSTVDLSDHTKRYSRRSPQRITSRNDRFDVVESQGRSRAGEFYHPAQGRLPYGYDRGNKHDRHGDDQREYGDRYQSHSVKPYDRNDVVKQFRNNTGDKFRARISAPRSPEHQRRASPRRFDRSFER